MDVRAVLNRPGLRWGAAVTAMGAAACSWWALGPARSPSTRHRRLESPPRPQPGERVRARETGPDPGQQPSRPTPRLGPEERLAPTRGQQERLDHVPAPDRWVVVGGSSDRCRTHHTNFTAPQAADPTGPPFTRTTHPKPYHSARGRHTPPSEAHIPGVCAPGR
ncbi:hypothetical protein ACFQ2M_39550 [Kitasatospora saccharophila]